MKIAVITYWDSLDNYGQILQGFALQRYLCSIGHEAFIVRFHEEKSPMSFFDSLKRFSPKHLSNYARYKASLKNAAIFNDAHPRRFAEFKKGNLNYSEREYWSFEQLLCADWSCIDAFICGSDQIWSPKDMNNWLSYMLAFVPNRCRKIAYACSFGRTSLDETFMQELRRQLASFNAVGLRENSGVAICRKANCIDAKLVCDPTLLLHASDYTGLFGDYNISKSAFIYLLNWKMKLPYDEIKSCLSNLGLEATYFPTRGTENIWEADKELTINNWIKRIASSQLVVTNSFHGTVFSIIFHRPFVSIALDGKDSGMNDRLDTLLTTVGLENRIFKQSGGQSVYDIAKMPIDWSDVEQRLDSLRKSGRDLINLGLEGNDKLDQNQHQICFLTSGAVHHRYGGLDRVTELLADSFEQQGHKVYYLSSTKREVFDKQRQHFLPSSAPYECEQNILAFNTFLKDNNIDVLINQEAQVDITLPITAQLRSHIKVLSVVHFSPNYIDDNHFKNKFGRSKSLLSKILNNLFTIPFIRNGALYYLRNQLAKNYRKQLAWCDNLILLSDRFKTDILNLVGDKVELYKLTAINNPCLINKQMDDDSEKKENIILYVGRMDIPFKRIDHILDIWKKISVNHDDWQLMLVGDGADRLELEDKVKKEGIKHVSFEGIQSPEYYYKRAKMLLLTSSSSEGWGMVLVEGQHYGCVPMCYHSYSAIADIVEDGVTGGLVENNDTNALISRIEQAINNPKKLETMSLACKKNVRNFDINIISKQWIKLMLK